MPGDIVLVVRDWIDVATPEVYLASARFKSHGAAAAKDIRYPPNANTL
jgi:hypothetical protein